jgi:hypothetical protein
MSHETNVLARVWFEGRRIFEDTVVAVECDGETVTVTHEEGESEWRSDEWDDVTVQYDP